MEFRPANAGELDDIMTIYDVSRRIMTEMGIDQWRGGYPSRELISEDIRQGACHVCCQDGRVIAAVALMLHDDPTYMRIYDGCWRSNGSYAVIHRLAVAQEHRCRGVASYILGEIRRTVLARGWHSIKIDTHERNIPMQRLLVGNGYEYCGRIRLEDGSERLAFEALI